MSLMVSTGAEPKALSDLVKYEVSPSFTRTSGIFKAVTGAAMALAFGTILGLDDSLSIASAANEGNTGNGTISTAAALKAGAQPGVYDVVFLTATTFAVFDPAGNRLADGATAAAYDNGQIGFTITAGGEAFVAGDGFAITVTESAGKYAPLSLTAVDGQHIVAGIAIAPVTAAADADGYGLVLANGPATVLRSELVYPGSATTAQKAAIDAQLLARNIKVVDAV